MLVVAARGPSRPRGAPFAPVIRETGSEGRGTPPGCSGDYPVRPVDDGPLPGSERMSASGHCTSAGRASKISSRARASSTRCGGLQLMVETPGRRWSSAATRAWSPRTRPARTGRADEGVAEGEAEGLDGRGGSLAADDQRGVVARAERKVTDTGGRLWHPWLRINRVLRVMLQTRWSAEAWSQVRVEFRKALALRSEIRRAGWFN